MELYTRVLRAEARSSAGAAAAEDDVDDADEDGNDDEEGRGRVVARRGGGCGAPPFAQASAGDVAAQYDLGRAYYDG